MKKIFTLICVVVMAAQSSMISAQTATMKVWKDGVVTAKYATADVDSVTFDSDVENPEDGIYVIKGHRFVDLGLPSGLLWAETNIGAESAADDGDYFAWGETEVQSDNAYTWDSYSFTFSLTEYNKTDQKVTLDSDDDVATAKWGSHCYMPSADDFVELLSNCTWTWASKTTSSNEKINGYQVKSKANDKSIFIPASGGRYNGKLNSHNSYGSYYTATLEKVGSYNAYCFGFSSTNREVSAGSRSDGHTVRPVAKL
jgi:hypothetical protein